MLGRNTNSIVILLALLGLTVTFANAGILDFLSHLKSPIPHQLIEKLPIQFSFPKIQFSTKPEPFFSKSPPKFFDKPNHPPQFFKNPGGPHPHAAKPIVEFHNKPVPHVISQAPAQLLAQSHLPVHDKFTEVNFYFKENLHGKPKHVVLRKDKCLNVAANYFFEKPRSIWSSDCIMVYRQDFCHGEGVRIAGMVHELRSAGLYKGLSSIKPCEDNIHITFKHG